MRASDKEVLYMDASEFPIFESEDMAFLQRILNDITDEYASYGKMSEKEMLYLRLQLAAALFRCAETGERDYTRLKRSAIEAVSPAPTSASDA
jgi:hypothetical protein